jgi:hypothetical protein
VIKVVSKGGIMKAIDNWIVDDTEILNAVLLPLAKCGSEKEYTGVIFKNGSSIDIPGATFFEKIKTELYKEVMGKTCDRCGRVMNNSWEIEGMPHVPLVGRVRK